MSLFAQEFQHRGKIHQTQENVWRETVSKFNVHLFVMDPLIVSTRAGHLRVADAAVDPRLSPRNRFARLCVQEMYFASSLLVDVL